MKPLPLSEMNRLVGAQFARIHGEAGHFHLPRWWADQVRAIAAAQDENEAAAIAKWDRLPLAERQLRLLRYLRAQPSWPALRGGPRG